ncbi:hypothetical protein EDE08_118120 [Bradyrhizobium sp. R2.2-H]|jgi:hypothetical protein|uniref:DUF411 domain-containing protein n=1 Tax=unclassified Bradyrhizobium TaxID=2631580 RepID=UPI0010506F60|nr:MULTISPECIES: DUF411 domain-containing protein [unclassified Bradyrhizobium]TCU63727.1 hypothetical protein EDE10_11811 [Bradyrhizobium sp. Y-H1]TCU65761.1 hypothetical protein EDE08_118120 [Bradyrhizobium sp. R2.2-H]
MTDQKRSAEKDGFARRSFLALIAAATLGAAARPAVAAESVIKVHKDPNCGCCSGWVQHLRDAGFTVQVDDASDLPGVRKRLGVPADLAACHTAEVDGYVLEGHVPAPAVRRLLTERPKALGLAVPGMPVGSPGMEGGHPQPYAVVQFGPAGRTTFMRFVGKEAVG